MASAGRLEPCRRCQMRTRGGKRQKSLRPRGNRPRVRAKSKRAKIDPAYTALHARDLPLEAFTASAGEREEERRGRVRGEEERRGQADIELCLAAPLLESTGRSSLSQRRSRPASPLGLLHLPLGVSVLVHLECTCLPASSRRRRLQVRGPPASSCHCRPQVRGPPASSRRHRPQIHVHRTCPSARVCPHLTTCMPPASSCVLAHQISQLSTDFHICLLCLCS
jgi:hypothetical protein